MEHGSRRFREAVTLVGGGPFDFADLETARARAPVLVAADQAADRLREMGRMPDLIVGDMDSISDLEAWRRRDVRVLHLTEQDTTDFEKCLYSTEAPLYVALGFTGGRLDHTLAVLHALMRYPEKRVVVVSAAEAVVLLPPGRVLRLPVRAGETVSIFPLAETTGTLSEGLVWPVEGLTMAPGRQIGTSNIASAHEIALAFDRAGAVLMLRRESLEPLIDAFAARTGRDA
jgi:thiamine pyrophosphokinase